MANRIEEISDSVYESLKTTPSGEVEETEEIDTVAIDLPDMYRDNERKARELKEAPRQHGANPGTLMATESVMQILGPKYREYKGALEQLQSQGETERADALRQQYLLDDFLPAVEAVINRTSPDDLLNSKESLALLNQYSGALVPKGYIEGYIKNAYSQILGRREPVSDGMVTHQLRKIRAACAEGAPRVACGEAKRLKKQIDNGELLASEADYTIISRIASY